MLNLSNEMWKITTKNFPYTSVAVHLDVLNNTTQVWTNGNII